MGRNFPDQALLVIKDGRIGIASINTTYSGAIIDNVFTEFPAHIYGRPVRPDLVVKYLVAGCSPQAYIITSQGWVWKKGWVKTKNTSGRIPPPEAITDLPSEERLEVLLFIGRSLNGLQVYSKYFEVKREIHGDDSSKLLDMVELKGWRPANANDLQPMQ